MTIPEGYLEYCMKHQHYPNEALPFPPEIQLDIVIIEGLETRFIWRRAETPGTRDDTTREGRNEPTYQRGGRARARDDFIGRGQRQRGCGRGHGHTHGRMDKTRATRALIDAFEIETQFSEPEQTFLRRCASNLSTECKRLHESRGSESRRFKELERENIYLSRLSSNTQFNLDSRPLNPGPQSRNKVLDNRAFRPSSRRTEAGPSGLNHTEMEATAPLVGTQTTSVPLPPSAEAREMEIDDSEKEPQGERLGITQILLALLLTTNIFLSLTQMLRIDPFQGSGGRM